MRREDCSYRVDKSINGTISWQFNGLNINDNSSSLSSSKMMISSKIITILVENDTKVKNRVLMKLRMMMMKQYWESPIQLAINIIIMSSTTSWSITTLFKLIKQI